MKRLFFVFVLVFFASLFISCNNEQVLSSPESANCYIISESGCYTFATVKGNSDESVGEVASASVLWESFGTDVAPNIGDLIKSVSYNDGFIAFQTADDFKEGNAVIAAKDANGKILWSWHIWLTDQPQGQVYYNNAGTMMDRNLGATSTTPGDAGTLGLLYQWGRKDPFLGSWTFPYDSPLEAKSTIIWPSPVESTLSTGTIAYATANPTTFITCNFSYVDWYYADWYYIWSSSTDNTRWTTSDKTKSIYDPCPAGWRVPDGGSNGVWSKALGSSIDFTYKSLCDSSEGKNFSGRFSSDQIIWYPLSSNLEYYDGSIRGECDRDCICGDYWSASPSNYGVYHLSFDNYGYVNPSDSYGIRANGKSVRCIQVID